MSFVGYSECEMSLKVPYVFSNFCCKVTSIVDAYSRTQHSSKIVLVARAMFAVEPEEAEAPIFVLP